MAETVVSTPRGQFEVVRPHTLAVSPLRAWSAADQLVLDELAIDDLGRLLVVNDEFGALTVALAASEPVSWGDSALSRAAIDANLARNDLAALGSERHLGGDQRPTGLFDTIVVRVPKTLALLEYQLRLLRPDCGPNTRIVGAAMARHIHRTTLAAFEQYLGPTTSSLATRKARLLHVHSIEAPSTGDDTELAGTSFVTRRNVTVVEAPGTFSAGHVDAGSGLLLDVLCDQAESLPRLTARVADLGCGNGVLSATMAKHRPQAHFALFDVSDLAIWSARQTWQANALAPDRAAFVVADGFGATEPGSFDVVITNPPFHQGHARDGDLTDRLLADAAQALAPDGAIYVVAQRHLNMHTRLARSFTDVQVLSKHPTHVVLRAKQKDL